MLSVLLSAVDSASRRNPVSDMKGLLVESVTVLGCQASVPSSSFAHFSLSSSFHSPVGWLGISGGKK